MDRRMALEAGYKLIFPGMECEIVSFVGKGANAMVYEGAYPDREFPALRHKVLVKELFPLHPQGKIFRNGQGDICWTEDAASVMALHKTSFQRANHVHVKLLGQCPEDLDTNINTFSLHRTLYTVLGFSGGRTLEQELEKGNAPAAPLAAHVCRMAKILDVLEAFHQSGFLHLDLSPDNILLIGEGRKERISLIDYNSVHAIQEIKEQNMAYCSTKEGFTAPEIYAGRFSEVGYPTDLYSLAAIFYRMLSGKDLSFLQAVCGNAPAVFDAPCLKAMPDTVCSMARKILRRGLAALVSRRYQAVAQMRQDFAELQDRIEGKGITHPALWETGRASILRAVRANPAFGYIKEEESLFPVLGKTEQGNVVALDGLIEKMVSPKGSSVFLLGAGGAGKTTALMRAAYLQPLIYNGMDPAFAYISLYGWSEGMDSYIKDRILESLRFKPHTATMEMARHELLLMLSEPMGTRQGERPKLIMLLDGLNEARGNIDGLLQEIAELSQMQGLRILLASRSDVEGIAFPRVWLRPLEGAEVQRILGKHGVLMPQEETLAEMLRTPMMLSIYIQTVQNQGKQLLIQSQEQMLDSYFAAILSKEIQEFSEDSRERWQTEAALSYILPELANVMGKKGRALSDQDMLPLVEKYYRRIKKRAATKVFPEWIGHMAEIFSGAENGEAWYGRMVHGILWRRLGLLVRDGQGNYRMFHPLIEEYFRKRQRSFRWKILYYEKRRQVPAAICCALGLGLAAQAFLQSVPFEKEPYGSGGVLEEIPEEMRYSKDISETVLDAAFTAYITCGKQYGCFKELLSCLQAANMDEDEYGRVVRECQDTLEPLSGVNASQASGYLEQLYLSGEAMPWSGQPLSEEDYLAMAALPKERAEGYGKCLQALLQAREDEKAWEYFDGAGFMEKLKELLDADARLLGKYYEQVVAPELAAMEQSGTEEDAQNHKLYMKTYALVPSQNEKTREVIEAGEDIEIYREAQKSALRKVHENGLMEMYP